MTSDETENEMPPLLDSNESDDDETLPQLIADSTDEDEDEEGQAALEQLRAFSQLNDAQKQAHIEEQEEKKREQVKHERERELAIKRKQEKREIEIRELKEQKQRKKLEQKRAREEALKEKKRLDLQHYAGAFADKLSDGISRFIEKDYSIAYSLLHEAVCMLGAKHSTLDVETALRPSARERLRFMLPTKNRTLIDYVMIRCLFEADHDTSREEHIMNKLADLLLKFPAPFVYWLKGRALNRYQPLNEEIGKHLLHASEINSDDCRYHLTADCILAESDRNILQGLIAEEVETFERRPKPDATCCYYACSLARIYWNNSATAFYARIVCEAQETHGDLIYHKGCWRSVIKKRFGTIPREACVGLPCPASECAGGVIAAYEELNGDGTVRGRWGTHNKATMTILGDGDADEEPERDVVPAEEEGTMEEHGELRDDDPPEETQEEQAATEPIAASVGERHSFAATRVSAYSVDLTAATVILPRDQTLEDSHAKVERAARRAKVKKNKVKAKAKMSLGEFFKEVETKEAEREAERMSIKAQLSPVDRAVGDLKKTLATLSRRNTKKLTRTKPSQRVAAE